MHDDQGSICKSGETCLPTKQVSLHERWCFDRHCPVVWMIQSPAPSRGLPFTRGGSRTSIRNNSPSLELPDDVSREEDVPRIPVPSYERKDDLPQNPSLSYLFHSTILSDSLAKNRFPDSTADRKHSVTSTVPHFFTLGTE